MENTCLSAFFLAEGWRLPAALLVALQADQQTRIPDSTGSLLAHDNGLHECIIQILERVEMMQQKETTHHGFKGNQHQQLCSEC
jgi:hypothetical protein